MKESLISVDHSLDLSRSVPHINRWQAWVVCLSASLFFFYEFIQMNMFDAISLPLMQAFHIQATQLGQLSSFYFISNVIFLFPAGMLLDRYSTRKIILFSLGVCILGITSFALTTSLFSACIFRFLMGIGSAFCFLSVIRLATRWFAATRLALVTGVIVTMAMLGGIAAQTPLTLLLEALNWRKVLLIDAAFGFLIFLIIASLVKDFPYYYLEHHRVERQKINEMGYWKSMGLAFLKLQNWLGGIYTCLMNLPLCLLGGIWGILYLSDAHHIPKIEATYITSMLFMGTVVGGPLVGFLSDKIGFRRLPMLVGAILSLALVIVIIEIPHLSFFSLLVLFLAMGLTTSSQIIGYPIVAENSIPVITAMSVSVVNITTMGGQAIFQPLFGHLMDLHTIYFHHSMGGYVASDFCWAMLILPLGFLIALGAAFCLRETSCRSSNE
ncbi:MFS transporter [Coxiella-like endosymbiont]|uniref:MFS transporter n=1 Tax=Coxiella-like endosymbiont TaxID=1592897 RepID=UPI000C8053A1|nr:MFS transporter [Coxiella-like endosymbiont]PMB54326.1 L-Proline/Glycine betaine transporter ProP [Coxiella-like endosymbiont]